MEILMKILLGPVLGALIGLITNTIALRMLFRPLHPVEIRGRRLPFTPGIIPREQPRIAKALGGVVRNWLLTDEVMKQALSSERSLSRLDGLYDRLLAYLHTEERPLRELLAGWLGEEQLPALVQSSERNLAVWVSERVAAQDLKQLLILPLLRQAVADYKQRGGLKAMFLSLIDDEALLSLADGLEVSVRKYIDEKLPGVIETMLTQEADRLLDSPVCELAVRYAPQLEKLRGQCRALYCRLLERQLPRLLNSLDIESIVEERIMSLPPAELEQLVLAVVKKELLAIVWLGGLIGLLLGGLVMLLP